MKPKQIVKIIMDIAMTVLLLLLMAYSLVGVQTHEWLGLGSFALFAVHHGLNLQWTRGVCKGRYTPYRIAQTALVGAAFVSMLGSMVSGIVLSRYALRFLPVTGGRSWARTVHMLSAYWGFVFISLHLGLHWSGMMGMAKRMFPKPSAARAWAVRITGFLIAGYGVYAFIRREIGSYLLFQIQFVFFDFEEPLFFFLTDYLAVMSLFVLIGHYLAEGLKRMAKKPKAL